jgi:hypothetical protein
VLLSFVEPPLHKKPIQSVPLSGLLRIHTKRVFAWACGASSSSLGGAVVELALEDAGRVGASLAATDDWGVAELARCAMVGRCPVSLGCSAAQASMSKAHAKMARSSMRLVVTPGAP